MDLLNIVQVDKNQYRMLRAQRKIITTGQTNANNQSLFLGRRALVPVAQNHCHRQCSKMLACTIVALYPIPPSLSHTRCEKHLVFQVFGHLFLKFLKRLVFFLLSPIRFDLHICGRIGLVGVLSCHFLESGILRVQIDLEFVSSIFLAPFLNNFSNVETASNSWIMVSPAWRAGSVTRLTLSTQNRSAAALRLPDIGKESSKRLLGFGRHNSIMEACVKCVLDICAARGNLSVS